MRKTVNLIFFQIILSIISAYLISQMSIWGKIGISFFFQEYSILKNPIITAPIIFCVHLLVIAILHLIYAFKSNKIKNMASLIVLILSIIGLFLTYQDFTNEFSHKILQSNFHFGAYLVWIGTIISSIFYLLKKSQKNLKI